MKTLILILSTTLLLSCSSSNQVSSTKKVNATNTVVAKNKTDLNCKKTRKTGSRLNTRTCITNEQKELERKESQDAMRNSVNGQNRVTPSAGGN